MSSITATQANRDTLMVPDAAAILKRFYFLCRELVLMEAGWLASTEHWEMKILLPEILWQDSITVGSLRQRVLELRFPEREIDLSPDEGLVALWRQLYNAPDAFAFSEALRRAIKPALRGHFDQERVERLCTLQRNARVDLAHDRA